MCFFISFMPATFWAIVGYFVLFSTTKTEGGVGTFGKALAIWVFVIVVLILTGGAYISLAGFCPISNLMSNCGQ